MPRMHTATRFSPGRDEEFPESKETRNRKKAVRKAADLLHEDARRTYAWMEHLRDAWGPEWDPQD